MDVPKAPQSCRRVALEIEMDKKLKRKINKTEKEINLSRRKTCPPYFPFCGGKIGL
jgi:hypothetical protein